MKSDSKRRTLERMLQKCPDSLKPKEIPHWFPISKNVVYRLINNGELRSYRMTHGTMIRKEDFIDYLLAHAEDTNRSFGIRKPDREDDV